MISPQTSLFSLESVTEFCIPGSISLCLQGMGRCNVGFIQSSIVYPEVISVFFLFLPLNFSYWYRQRQVRKPPFACLLVMWPHDHVKKYIVGKVHWPLPKNLWLQKGRGSGQTASVRLTPNNRLLKDPKMTVLELQPLTSTTIFIIVQLYVKKKKWTETREE